MSTETQSLALEQRIMHGAQELFSRYGLKSVTMDDIAKHVGMSKKTIYQAFDDKNKIITAVVNHEMAQQQNCFMQFHEEAKDPVHEMVMIMQFIGKTFSRFNPNLFYDMQKYHPEAWKLFREFKESCALENIINNIERGKEAGLYRKSVNSRILTTMRLEQVEIAMDPRVFPPDRFAISEVQVQILEHFLHGICTLRGHRLMNKYLQINEEE
jgi:TetR/AcrR family transcriptional regulator, cholesterol catabolism regulator